MIHLDVVIPDTDDLLDTNAYGAGALMRWEWSATVDGIYAEGGTVPLVSGTTVYDIWDPNHDVGTWYRTRISNAVPNSYSGYTVPYQTTEQGNYLSVSQLRGFQLGGTLGDEELLVILSAARQDIERAAGPMGLTTEVLRGGPGDLLYLSRQPLYVSAIVEDETTLDPDDYALQGQLLMRLATGPNGRSWWGARVVVTYQAADDLASRQRVQLALVKQDLGYSPGLSSQRIGEWSESYGTAEYRAERAEIIGSLSGGEVLIR